VKKPTARRPTPPKTSPAAAGNNNQQPSGNVTRVQTQQWAGPLPPPAILDQFNNVVENGAERIVSAWEGETKHRQTLEERDLNWSIFEAIFGKILAAVFIAGLFGLVIYCASIGAIWLAAFFGGIGIASVVGAFVQTNRTKK